MWVAVKENSHPGSGVKMLLLLAAQVVQATQDVGFIF